MIVEVRSSRQFDDNIADKHWIPPPDQQLTIMEENSLEDMEGYLEVKSAKMLTPNKKYWFVLSQTCLHFYENKYGWGGWVCESSFEIRFLQGVKSKGQGHSGQRCYRKSS